MTKVVETPVVAEEAPVYGGGRFSEPVRVAGLMKLRQPESFDALLLADKISAGLPVGAATHLGRSLEVLGHNTIHEIIPEATLRRAEKKKRLSKDSSEKLYDIARVLDQTARMFQGDAEEAARFLRRPHPLLDGRTPFDVAKSSTAGADAVLDLLRRADAGVAI